MKDALKLLKREAGNLQKLRLDLGAQDKDYLCLLLRFKGLKRADFRLWSYGNERYVHKKDSENGRFSLDLRKIAEMVVRPREK